MNSPWLVGTLADAVLSTSACLLRLYLTRSEMSTILSPCFSENSRSWGRRAMLPSESFTISQRTPAGPQPARVERS